MTPKSTPTPAQPESAALSGRRFEDRLGVLRKKASQGEWHSTDDSPIDIIANGIFVGEVSGSKSNPTSQADAALIVLLCSPSRSKLVEEVIRAARELLTEALACSHFEDEHSNEHVVVNLEKSVDALDASLDSGGEGDE